MIENSCYIIIERWPFEVYLNDVYLNKDHLELYKQLWKEKHKFGIKESSIKEYKIKIYDFNQLKNGDEPSELYIVIRPVMTKVEETTRVFINKKNALKYISSSKDKSLEIFEREVFDEDKIRIFFES